MSRECNQEKNIHKWLNSNDEGPRNGQRCICGLITYEATKRYAEPPPLGIHVTDGLSGADKVGG